MSTSASGFAAVGVVLPDADAARRIAKGGGTLFNALGGLEGLALSLFKTPRMVVFFIFAMLLGVALPVSNTFSNPFLHDLARNLRYQSGL
ncbi:hypothetical protein ACLEEB_05905 [Lonsdalea quercina]|uniref:Nucleoside H+ symporter n=2 Tax=Lonsdalea quercina TaxID=71657 RepID=A0A1H3Z901_9GAMM|nr:hypothetical protein [Lonsdalea quercina]SEA19854.1 Nucleoside H+ symporter [Lonsdalea quercina]